MLASGTKSYSFFARKFPFFLFLPNFFKKPYLCHPPWGAHIHSLGPNAYLAKKSISNTLFFPPLSSNAEPVVPTRIYVGNGILLRCPTTIWLQIIPHNIYRLRRPTLLDPDPHRRHHLDDFLISLLDSHTCRSFMLSFSCLCASMGISIADNKTCGPAQELVYLGIEVITVCQFI